jgi:hypothetical protein
MRDVHNSRTTESPMGRSTSQLNVPLVRLVVSGARVTVSTAVCCPETNIPNYIISSAELRGSEGRGQTYVFLQRGSYVLD